MSTVEKNAKIIATIGPVSRNKEMIWKLHQAGANIFRMNFSHGDHSDHIKVITWVRELNEEHGTNICLLQDLQGPKIRVNQVKDGGADIKPGDKIQIEAGDFEGDATKISTTYKTIANDVKAGDQILIDDGNLELKVVDTDGTTVTAEVVFGGKLKSRKGINLPNTDVSEPSLTEKDLKDLEFGIEHNVDWIALSFVRTAEDIVDLKERIKASGKNIKVICKMEKPEAIDNMDAIIEATDALMVARGDLGVEIDMAKVPMVQKEMIEKCNKASKPVIVATQMLESMISNPRPTRAETSDVANAITDGADVVMLSGESAAGDYPEQAVTSMARIIREVESHNTGLYKYYDVEGETKEDVLAKGVVTAAAKLSEQTDAKAIVGITGSGYTAYEIAKHRPASKIYMFTPNKELITRLNLIWGVTAFHYDHESTSSDETFEQIQGILKEKGLVEAGDVIVNTASMPSWKHGKTNMCKVSVVE
ncbi:MAG: pyruvate kinase [Cytophagales bacterium]|nr:pyruvate kinase [Cytophagales bacterium]